MGECWGQPSFKSGCCGEGRIGAPSFVCRSTKEVRRGTHVQSNCKTGRSVTPKAFLAADLVVASSMNVIAFPANLVCFVDW